MEDRINQGYRLFVEHNPEKQELVGVYIKATGGATTKIRTGKQELDFFKILPSTKEQIEAGSILEIEKRGKKYQANLTKGINTQIAQISSDYFLNTLVDLEENLQTENKKDNIR